MTKPTNIVIDLSGMVWATRHGEIRGDNEDRRAVKALLVEKAITGIATFAKMFKADGILVAMDSPHVWRKKVYPEYKGNRDGDRDLYYEEVIESMELLREFFLEYTDITAVSVDTAEADDIIAVASRNTPHETVIISSDKDFIQLIGPNVRLYAPVIKGERKSEDAGFDLFVKCIRGDHGDNIPSAYPRILTKRLEKAWTDATEMANIMETTLKDGRLVADAYELNRSLIDLSRIPDDLSETILSVIKEVNERPGSYNYLNVVRFLARLGLKDFAKGIRQYSDIFRMRYHMSPSEIVYG